MITEIAVEICAIKTETKKTQLQEWLIRLKIKRTTNKQEKICVHKRKVYAKKLRDKNNRIGLYKPSLT